MMRNFIPVLFTAFTLLTGCTQLVETVPSVPQPTAVTSSVDYGDCNTAHAAPAGSDIIQACPDRDGDRVRGPERCGEVWPNDIPKGCVPRYDQGKIEQARLAWWDYVMDPLAHPFNEDDWLSPVDCDDHDPGTNQYTEDIPNDGVDQDCDGVDRHVVLYADADQDGYPLSPEQSVGRWMPVICHGSVYDDVVCDIETRWIWIEAREDGLADCRDDDPAVNPGQAELVEPNPIDSNCDGVVTCLADNDGDGFGNDTEAGISSFDLSCRHPGLTTAWGDCDDTNDAINFWTFESINSIDDNCNGQIDERHCQLGFFLDPIVGSAWNGWRANLLIGAMNREGVYTPATIALGAGGTPTPTLGYGSPSWIWTNDQYVDPGTGGDISIGSTSGQMYVTIVTDGDYLGGLVINGNYWVSGGLNYWGVLKHVIDVGDDVGDVPFRISGQLLMCSDEAMSLGASVRMTSSIVNNDLHIDLSRL